MPSRPALSVLTVLLFHPQVSFSQPESARLLGLCSYLPAGSGGSAAVAAAESPADDLGPVLVLRTFPAEEPFFYSIAAIEQIEAQGVSVFAASMGLPEASVAEISKEVVSRLQRLDSQRSHASSASESKCSKPVPGRFSERRTSLRTADEIVNGERFSLSELVRRAPHAVIGEVVEVVPGLMTTLPAALIRVRVITSLVGDEKLLGPGSEFAYTSDFFAFDLRGRRICAVNPDFFFPARGKTALFLLPLENPYLGLYDPHGEFELVGGDLLVSPYTWVDLAQRQVTLESIEAELGD